MLTLSSTSGVAGQKETESPSPLSSLRSTARSNEEEAQKKKSIVSKVSFFGKGLAAKHNRLHGLYLLYQTAIKRGLTILDMYTDIRVTYGLRNNPVYFMLSCIFLATPFLLVWHGSLRIMQDTLVKKLNSIINTSQKGPKTIKCIQAIINIFIMLYVFPIIGMFGMVLIEIWWILYDIYTGLMAFIFGVLFIQTADDERVALKQFRSTVEFFGESVPQILLQLFLFVQLDSGHIDIDPFDLYLSLFISFVSLLFHIYKFRAMAKLHGLYWFECALSVLQLSQISIQKFVPRLGALQKGLINGLNLSAFQFDKESVSLLISTLNNKHEFPKCELQAIKLSVGSIRNLDYNMCKLLGKTVYDHNKDAHILITKTYSNVQVHDIWNKMDVDNSGSIKMNTFTEFVDTEVAQFHDIYSYTKDERALLFETIAPREKGEVVFLYDFYDLIMSYKTPVSHFGFDILTVSHPIHYIAHETVAIMRDIADTDGGEEAVDDAKDRISALKCFYNLCHGAHFLKVHRFIYHANESNNHYLFALIESVYVLHSTSNEALSSIVDALKEFIWYLFEDILNSKDFMDVSQEILNHRNNSINNSDYKLPLNHVYLEQLKDETFAGFNIFEYCFLINADQHHHQCKAFAFLMNKYIETLNKQTPEHCLLIDKKRGLYHLYYFSNGFLLKDENKKTAFDYAKEHKLEAFIRFYQSFVINEDTLSHLIKSNQFVDVLSLFSSTDEATERKKEESHGFFFTALLVKNLISEQHHGQILQILIEQRQNRDVLADYVEILCRYRATFRINQDDDAFNLAIKMRDSLVINKLIQLNEEMEIKEFAMIINKDRNILKSLTKTRSYDLLHSLLDCKDFEVEEKSQNGDAVDCFKTDVQTLLVVANALENNLNNNILQRFSEQQLHKLYEHCYDLYEDLTAKGKHGANKIARNLTEMPYICVIIIILRKYLNIKNEPYFQHCVAVIKPKYIPSLADFNNASYFTSCAETDFTIWKFKEMNVTNDIQHFQVTPDEKVELRLELKAYNTHFDATGKYIIVSHYNTGDVYVYEWDKMSTLSKYKRLIGHDNEKVAFGVFLNVKHGKYSQHQTRYVITSSYDKTCIFWDIEENKILQRFEYAKHWAYEPVYCQLSEKYNYMILLIFIAYDGNVYVCNLETGQLITFWTVIEGGRCYRLQIASDAKLIAVGYGSHEKGESYIGNIKLYDFNTDEIMQCKGNMFEPKTLHRIENDNGLCPISFISNNILVWTDKKTDNLYWLKRNTNADSAPFESGQFKLPFPVTWSSFNNQKGFVVLKTSKKFEMLFIMDLCQIIDSIP